jgi:hypothetical protein
VHGDATTLTRNTHSSSSATVEVHYPFHPLCGHELEVVRASRSADGAVTVADPTGRRLKIPSWMLSAEAAELCLSAQASVSARALLNLAELLETHLPQPSCEPQEAEDRLSPAGPGPERRSIREAASTRGRAGRGTRRASRGARSQAQSGGGGADGTSAGEDASSTGRQGR